MAGFSNTKPITVPVSKNLSILSAVSGGKRVFKKCGFINDVGSRQVNESQLVKIMADLGGQGGMIEIVGLLHKEVNTSMSTSWKEPTLPMMDLFKIAGVTASLNQVVQGLSGGAVSGGHLLSTRRFWDGTSPLKCSLDIKFVAIHANKVEEEVLEPCTRIQQIASPYIYNVTGVVNPPGPGFKDGTGDKITIKVGKFLTFNTVIITGVDINYDNKCDENGKPLSATCRISFETLDMIHKTKLDEIAGTEELIQEIKPQTQVLPIKKQQEAVLPSVQFIPSGPVGGVQVVVPQ